MANTFLQHVNKHKQREAKMAILDRPKDQRGLRDNGASWVGGLDVVVDELLDLGLGGGVEKDGVTVGV